MVLGLSDDEGLTGLCTGWLGCVPLPCEAREAREASFDLTLRNFSVDELSLKVLGAREFERGAPRKL